MFPVEDVFELGKEIYQFLFHYIIDYFQHTNNDVSLIIVFFMLFTNYIQ